MSPPIVRFLTKIVHPNVSRHGDVGIDIIQHNWSLALTISKLLLSVQSLLTDPFTEVYCRALHANQLLISKVYFLTYYMSIAIAGLHGTGAGPHVRE